MLFWATLYKGRVCLCDAGIDDIAEVELKQPSRLAELVEGVELILKCSVDGNTEPTVDWFRNYER